MLKDRLRVRYFIRDSHIIHGNAAIKILKNASNTYQNCYNNKLDTRLNTLGNAAANNASSCQYVIQTWRYTCNKSVHIVTVCIT
jgi:hypothetical protein